MTLELTRFGGRVRVLETAYAAHPERFVRKPATPAELPAARINQPEEDARGTANP